MDMKKYRKLFTLSKYLFSFLLIIFAYRTDRSILYFLGSIFELAVIFLVSETLMPNHPRAGCIVNDILCFLFNVQQAVMHFGLSYLTYIMLTNLSSAEDLGGRAFEYLMACVLVLLFSFLPIRRILKKNINVSSLLSISLAAELVFVMIFGSGYSPLFAYATLGMQVKENAEKTAYIRSQPNKTKEFYQDSVMDGTAGQKLSTLSTDQPNVILIFTEGLSQSVIEDERNIMPNVRNYEQNSLHFVNYYNHTAATYRGLIGQLYSGYQNNNTDTNSLISLQEIMQNEGYYTSFINTEPNNVEFTKYLNSFGFDDVISEDKDTYLTDKEAYSLLIETCEEQAESDTPFFTAIYTFNTHVSLDSDDAKFGDGENAELNKFYNCDTQFGTFMEVFNASAMADNTIVVFTADHCTYEDDAFHIAFPDQTRYDNFLDQIPFFIYEKTGTGKEINATGRNSLSLAPTILDYLNISEPNYFLGNSLFVNADSDPSMFKTVYTSNLIDLVSTTEGVPGPVDSSMEDKLKQTMQDYFAAAQQEREQ